MARPRKDSVLSQRHGGGAFFHEMERALDHFVDPQWLGTYSPLAAPYFLGNFFLTNTPDTPDGELATGRGKVLQRLLLTSAGDLSESLDKRYSPQKLLHLAYFRPNSKQNLTGVALELGLSPATFFRHRQEAIAELERAFIRRIRPALRSEAPKTDLFVGRSELIDTCLRSLAKHQLVSITGPSGIGKTALAAQITSIFAPSGRVFWHTFRLKHNDDLDSLIFALALFLQKCGSPLLWLQLTAEKGKVDDDLALGLLRESLFQIGQSNSPEPIVLCLDEMDVLRPDPAESAEHTRLRSFLDSLFQPRPPCGIILVGQQPVLEPDVHIPLAPLSNTEFQGMLIAHGVDLDNHTTQRLQDLTRGNPLLLRLFINLHRDGEKISELVRHLPASPSLQILLERVQRHLNPLERRLIAALSVYEGTCPRDVWREDEASVSSLIDRGLILADNSGGVMLQPVIHELALRQLTAEEREKLHLAAAFVFAARAQYTAAARHFIEASRADIAIPLWYANREQEIAQGQANAALELFRQISKDKQTEDARKILVLIRSELMSLTGNAAEGLAELNAGQWEDADPLTSRVSELKGIFLVMQGQVDNGLDQFRKGLEITETQLEQIRARLLTLTANANIRNRDLAGAKHVALLSKHIADVLQGSYLVESGHYKQALQFLLNALESAKELSDEIRIAMTHFQIGSLGIRMEDSILSEEHFKESLAIYSRIGDSVRIARTRSNLAVLYLHTGQYKKSLEQAEPALAFFEKLRQPFWIALNTSNIAEASLELGELDRAETFATRSLREEEASARPYALTTLGRIFLARRNESESERYLREAIAAAQEAQDKWAEAPAWRALAITLKAGNDPDTAQEAFDTALQLYVEMKLAKEVERTKSMMG